MNNNNNNNFKKIIKKIKIIKNKIIIIIIIIKFINSAALTKIRRAAGTCHSILTKRCAFRRRAKVAVDSVDRRSSAGKLFQVSGPETAKFLRPMAVTNSNYLSSLIEISSAAFF